MKGDTMNCPVCSTNRFTKSMVLEKDYWNCGCGYSTKNSKAEPNATSKSFKSGIVKPM